MQYPRSSRLCLYGILALTWLFNSTDGVSADLEKEAPVSVDELFDLKDEKTENKEPASVDELFEVERKTGDEARPLRWPDLNGFFQSELAYTYASPDHWSKFRNLLELGTHGSWGASLKWKASGRLMYDAIYDLTDFYPESVRNDQRFEPMIRETYLDYSAGDWDFRFGRQHIIWGEMVGLFFADVVSAKDLRQFVLPDFDLLRIPQWAMRAEYFKGGFHGEAIWIPYMTYNDIGKVGSEFFPFNPPPTPGFTTVIENDQRPNNTFENTAYGLRLSYLQSGWDTSLFYYSGLDLSPAFARNIVLAPAPTITYRSVHKRIHQVGSTLAKDFGPFVLKGEAVYTVDQPFLTTRLMDSDGLVSQDFLDYILGLDFSFLEDTRLNLQFFQRWFSHHDQHMIPDELESGVSALVSTRYFHPKVEPEVLFIHSLNRSDWNVQAKVTWEFLRNWRMVVGADIFGGQPTGLFGQFDAKDRVYGEFRYSF